MVKRQQAVRICFSQNTPLLAQKVELAIRTHCAAPQTLMMRGYYRGQPALFFVNPNTRLAAIFDSRGSYITGFVLSEKQAQYLFTSGRVN